MHRVFSAALILLLSACTAKEPTLTQARAVARVDQLIHDTASVLVPRPRLELIEHSMPPAMCLHEGGSAEQVVINRAYWLRGVPARENMNISRQVRAHWQAQGHRITASGGPGNPTLSGESSPDHFLLALVWAKGDHLYLASTSPCVWPDNSPAGEAPPNATNNLPSPGPAVLAEGTSIGRKPLTECNPPSLMGL
ncbi:hypothetical protein [Nonomuraea sp. NPDC003804]|uniref:hypothetical protein n=1 Tax=Nonomuraea sp. NPDC003804 TaxID=3154547 RepID=UPI0033B9A24B